MQVESAVASSDQVEVASVLEIVVPVTGLGAKVLDVNVKVPLENGVKPP